MSQLSEKELSVLNDLLTEEDLLIKKFQMLAEHTEDQFFVTCLHTFLLCKNLNCPTPLHVGMIYFDNHVIIISKTFPYL